MVKICLNMIVKNESKIITRLFDSLLNVIDTYCICDTGSTDSTIACIGDYFDSKGIDGKLVYKKFINFGKNRTYSLDEAKRMMNKLYPDEECYLLLLDADMVLRVGESFNKDLLKNGIYSLFQGGDHFQYSNTRLINTKIDVVVKCPTHEYYDIITPNITNEKIPISVLFIIDIGDGGSKENKFKRDIELLTSGIEEEPTNGRYYFYLANSYFDLGDYPNAIKYYNELIRVGSWVEEEFYSLYRLGISHERLKDERCILYWMKAYQKLPVRAESLYEIIKYYRWHSKHQLCNIFYQIAKDIPYPTNCSLFIHKDVYDYKILEEWTIFGYYFNRRDLHNEMFTLMNRKPKGEINSLFNNYKFYQVVLKPIQTINLNKHFLEFDKTIFGENYSFISSSPSIIKTDTGYLMNLRFVNYRINKDGSYPWYKYITTINKKVYLDETLEIFSSNDFETPLVDQHYVGIEDIKLFDHQGFIYYTGTSLHQNGNLGIFYGTYYTTQPIELRYSGAQSCEKNWVFIPNEGTQLKMIYKWDPLTIGVIENNEFKVTETKPMPNLFAQMRGSSNGCLFDSEIWFLVHFVHQNGGEPRHYYHSFVVFDIDMNLKRWSIPFKFTTGEIEYAIGLVIETDRIIITHSVWDRESYIRVYSKEHINNITWQKQ